MNRPRIVAIISAVAASTAAFVVTSRYHLGGTLAGAVLVPVIIIMVSHTSTEGVDALHKWARRRRLGAETGVTDASTADEEAPATRTGAESAQVRGPAAFVVDGEAPRRRKASVYTQWLLVGLTCVSVAVSVYALVAHEEPTVVRETVIERITESTDAGVAAGFTRKSDSGGTTPTTVTTAAVDPVTTTSDATTTTSTTVTDPSETTTTSTVEGTGGSSTTNTTLATGASLP